MINMLRASCLMVEFRYYEAKIEETEEAGNMISHEAV